MHQSYKARSFIYFKELSALSASLIIGNFAWDMLFQWSHLNWVILIILPDDKLRTPISKCQLFLWQPMQDQTSPSFSLLSRCWSQRTDQGLPRDNSLSAQASALLPFRKTQQVQQGIFARWLWKKPRCPLPTPVEGASLDYHSLEITLYQRKSVKLPTNKRIYCKEYFFPSWDIVIALVNGPHPRDAFVMVGLVTGRQYLGCLSQQQPFLLWVWSGNCSCPSTVVLKWDAAASYRATNSP